MNTLDDVNNFINASSEQIKLIEDQRQHIYNKLRRCTDTDKRVKLLSQRNDCTSALNALCKDVRTVNHIIEDNPEIQYQSKTKYSVSKIYY